jgi:Ca-activated chloride channel family protein
MKMHRAACLLGSLVAVLPPVAMSSQTPGATFSARVETIRVDALVTDRGQPLLGLTAADFEVLDDGVPQRVDFVAYERIPLNIVLALDISGSVAGDRLDHLRAAGAALLNDLGKEDQAALVTFSRAVTLAAPLTGDVEKVRRALDDAVGDGDTSLIDGAYAGVVIGESDVGRALLIVFSDGRDTASWLTSDIVIDTAKRSDVVVYGVSVGGGNPEFLRELTSLTGGRLFEVDKTANLRSIFLEALQEFRQRYLLSYTPQGVAKGGWHRLEVRVKRRATVKARSGYLAGS